MTVSKASLVGYDLVYIVKMALYFMNVPFLKIRVWRLVAPKFSLGHVAHWSRHMQEGL
jgi:hypothetical protein